MNVVCERGMNANVCEWDYIDICVCMKGMNINVNESVWMCVCKGEYESVWVCVKRNMNINLNMSVCVWSKGEWYINIVLCKVWRGIWWIWWIWREGNKCACMCVWL